MATMTRNHHDNKCIGQSSALIAKLLSHNISQSSLMLQYTKETQVYTYVLLSRVANVRVLITVPKSFSAGAFIGEKF